MAMGGGGPKPPPKPLANAVHDALDRPAVPGVSARIHFTNHLDRRLQHPGQRPAAHRRHGPPLGLARGRRQAAPRAAGPNERPAATPRSSSRRHQLSEIYDGGSNTVYKARCRRTTARTPAPTSRCPSLGPRSRTTIDRSREARRPERARSPPTSPGSRLHRARLAAATTAACSAAPRSPGTPSTASRCAPRSTPAAPARPVLRAGGDRRLLRKPSPPRLRRSPPPAGAQGRRPRPAAAASSSGGRRPADARGTGVGAGRRLGFPLAAPDTLVGPAPQRGPLRRSRRHAGARSSTYGQGLGGIAVIESAASAARRQCRAAGRRRRPQPAEGLDQRRDRRRARHGARHRGALQPRRRRLHRRSARSRRRRPRPRRGRSEQVSGAAARSRSAASSSATATWWPSTASTSPSSAGDVFGYLGPNGAGKTTSLRMMLGLIRAQRGQRAALRARPAGRASRALEGVAGFVEAPSLLPLPDRPPQPRPAAPRSTATAPRAASTRSLDDRRARPTAPRTASAATRTGCASAWGSPRRCCAGPSCCCSTSPRPGLDPAGMRDMRLLIRRLADGGMTVAALQPPARRGRGALQPGRDRPPGPDRLRGRARRAAPRGRRRSTGCARPTTSARWRCAAAQPGIEDVRAAQRRRDHLRAPTSEAVGELSLALAEAGALDPGAGPQPRHARGPLLLAHRGRRATRPRPPRRPRSGGAA